MVPDQTLPARARTGICSFSFPAPAPRGSGSPQPVPYIHFHPKKSASYIYTLSPLPLDGPPDGGHLDVGVGAGHDVGGRIWATF